VTHSRGQAEKSPRLDESSSGWPEPCPILISHGKPTHRVMARTALLRRQTQAPGLTGGIDCGKLDWPTRARGVELQGCGESVLRYRRHGKGVNQTLARVYTNPPVVGSGARPINPML